MALIDDLLQPGENLEQQLVERCVQSCDECRSDVQDINDLFPGQRIGWYSLCRLHAQAVRMLIHPTVFERNKLILTTHKQHLELVERIGNGYRYIDAHPEDRIRAENAIESFLSRLPPRYKVMDTTMVAQAINELHHIIAFWEQVESAIRELTG